MENCINLLCTFISNIEINDIVIFVLSVATLVAVLEWTGFLPSGVARYLHRNRLRESIDILQEFGINIDRHKRLNMSLAIDKTIDSDDLEKSLKNEFSDFEYKGTFGVGKVREVTVKNFLDLMSATTDPRNAKRFARYLTTYWKAKLVDSGEITSLDLGFVVTPKGGSPLLGYEFSQIMGVPLLLHSNGEDKFRTEDKELSFFSHFDCVEKPSMDKVALIVDDSATGGRKVKSAVDDLRRYGYTVTDCLVLFEPQKKDIRAQLRNSDISLHSITKR